MRLPSAGITADRWSVFGYVDGCQLFVGLLNGFVANLILWRLCVGWWPSSDSFWWKGEVADLGRCFGPIRFWWEGHYMVSFGEHVWFQWHPAAAK